MLQTICQYELLISNAFIWSLSRIDDDVASASAAASAGGGADGDHDKKDNPVTVAAAGDDNIMIHANTYTFYVWVWSIESNCRVICNSSIIVWSTHFKQHLRMTNSSPLGMGKGSTCFNNTMLEVVCK